MPTPGNARSPAPMLFLVSVLLTICSCERATPSAPRRTLIILAAASLAGPMTDLGPAFENAHPDLRLRFSFAGSNQLRTQLEAGAPGDIFLSADLRQIDAAAAAGAIDPATPRPFAETRLAILIPRANRAGLHALADLARPGVRLIIAHEAVPVGAYTRDILDRAASSPEYGPGFVSKLIANIVSREENAAAIAAKVGLDEADAGIAYASDAAGRGSTSLALIELPAELQQRARYVAAVTSRTAEPAAARQFIEFLTSPQAASILARCGFLPAEEGAP